MKTQRILFGCAYYDEYMPCERLEEDVRMMLEMGVNTVRIGESTWGTMEPHEGVFDFTHIDRVLDAMEKAGISVIVGTPTYAVPAWLAKKHPDVIARTTKGPGLYGARQNMDITHPAYLFHAERMIHRLMEHVRARSCVIGYQLDNETKHYDTAGEAVQKQFIDYLKERFPDIGAMNAAFGLNYWSNRISAWEDFPDVVGTINGSLGAEFDKFRRRLVERFLSWQADIVREYLRPGQFLTQNFDYEWRDYSFGVQPLVDHFRAAEAVDVAGVDIYHPSQSRLTGAEIAFGGDVSRSLKRDNYLVLETQAQGHADWMPYDNQLRMQAFSHIASGANSVMYWHWHSIHNSYETYWKGILSHDLLPNSVYRELCSLGRDLRELSPQLRNLKKRNDVALLISNESLTGLQWFPVDNGWSDCNYNDVVRWVYDSLYELGVECDILWPGASEEEMKTYRMIVVPALYSAPDSLLQSLVRYVEAGGELFVTFKSGFCDEYLAVSTDRQPHLLRECCGVTYQHFTIPEEVGLISCREALSIEDAPCLHFMELLVPETAETLLQYRHPQWGKYAAMTRNAYGRGHASYLGCMTDKETLKRLFSHLFSLPDCPVRPVSNCRFPLVVRTGWNEAGRRMLFYFNYSDETREAVYSFAAGVDLLTGRPVGTGEILVLPPWDFAVIEEG